jgi:hypothetical protein
MTEIAEAMDDRQRRIGQHAAAERPLWATQALGDLPGQPEARADWERRAAPELRAARRQEQHSRIETTRHAHEATAATRHGHHDQAALHHKAAQSWEALGDRARQVREKLAAAHDTRCEWDVMTEPTRRLARASRARRIRLPRARRHR